jgi:hypothetical protein
MITKDGITIEDDERTPCEIWTRVMGYHRPMSFFNIGKKGEFNERKYFDIDMAIKKATEGETK